MIYHNGLVLTGTVNIHHIYLGNILSSTKKILESFANDIGHTSWMKVLPSSYYYITKAGEKIPAANATRFAGSASFLATSKTSFDLTEDIIKGYVNQYITGGGGSADPNGIYMVFFDGSFAMAGWNTGANGWCGFPIAGTRISVIGDPSSFRMSKRNSNCIPSAFTNTANNDNKNNNGGSPNGDIGADSMAATVAREVAKQITNSDGHGWYCQAAANDPADDSGQQDIADLCDKRFMDAKNGGQFNVKVNGKEYLLSAIWEPGFGCVMAPQRGSPSVGPRAVSSISNEVAALRNPAVIRISQEGNFLHFVVNFSVPSGSFDNEILRRIPRNQSIQMPSKINSHQIYFENNNTINFQIFGSSDMLSAGPVDDSDSIDGQADIHRSLL
eukprot:gene23310-24714_t